MEEKNIYNELDGGPELANVYFSQCIQCKYYEIEEDQCQAFPDGIPESILYEMKKHDTILPNQTGETTFTKR